MGAITGDATNQDREAVTLSLHQPLAGPGKGHSINQVASILLASWSLALASK